MDFSKISSFLSFLIDVIPSDYFIVVHENSEITANKENLFDINDNELVRDPLVGQFSVICAS